MRVSFLCDGMWGWCVTVSLRGEVAGVRGTNLGAEGRMRGRDLARGLKWELVVGEFVCGPCLRGWNGVWQ